MTDRGFSHPGENRTVCFRFALENETIFETSGVIRRCRETIESPRCYTRSSFQSGRTFSSSRLKLHLPYVLLALNAKQFRLGDLEMQLTASNDGDIFKAHADTAPKSSRTRPPGRSLMSITFHREPRPFAGGGLLLYGGRPEPFVYRQRAVGDDDRAT